MTSKISEAEIIKRQNRKALAAQFLSSHLWNELILPELQYMEKEMPKYNPVHDCDIHKYALDNAYYSGKLSVVVLLKDTLSGWANEQIEEIK